MQTKSNVTVTAPKLTVAEELAATKALLAKAEAERNAAQQEANILRTRTIAARGLSTMQVIRETLAKKPTATVKEIVEACKTRGVPAKTESTVKTIRSDFLQTFYALQRAGKIVK